MIPKNENPLMGDNETEKRKVLWELFFLEYPEYKEMIDKYNASGHKWARFDYWAKRMRDRLNASRL